SNTTITIPAGQLTGTITIDPADDTLYEGNETVIVDITGVTGGNGATENGVQQAIVTITDDETTPTVTLSGTASIAENAAGTATITATITATLSTATTTATVVSLGFTGTASAGDYTASNTTITIPAGQLTGTITIDPADDTLYEGNETVI
ncbi:Calx-beta domain-containing protein, partial [Flavobacterium salmonis]